jgi:hypothetical protein
MTNLPQPNKWRLDPMTLSTNAAFVLVATVFLGLVGGLMQAGLVPSLAETALSQRYSPWNTLVPLRLWMGLAVTLSLILPIFALLICWRWLAARLVLLLYLIVMLVHILTEVVFNKLGLPGMNYVVGFTYTSYKVWQLWCYKRYINQQKRSGKGRRKLVLAILVGGIVFWTLNWLFLAINLVTRTAGA